MIVFMNFIVMNYNVQVRKIHIENANFFKP